MQKTGRPRSIDRDHVLDMAEKIVAEGGIVALTMDAVAQASGVTKGGVQYCFGNKDGLMKAMIERWGDRFDDQVALRKQDRSGAIAHIAAHIGITRESDAEDDSRFAAMMASLVPNSHYLDETRAWYRKQWDGLDVSTPEGRKARLAFIANEGAFLLRSFNFFELTQEEWQSIFNDIEALLPKSD
ncbi:TetR/AcrR family transcriptional regulator [Brucella thiophenivorans]|uniref:Bacterial regulatory, tetR family protein n=1 Tax=Brucella thiophenivorans TaxID=571255 RepID=A0A256G6H2_9HYPH|nr:TetR/AcrR family transcriptional regulator [Brucella thiophenivorans]OYR22703.1 bacterial regulatory, tetR family protein [Brucella thiophenivorans]